MDNRERYYRRGERDVLVNALAIDLLEQPVEELFLRLKQNPCNMVAAELAAVEKQLFEAVKATADALTPDP